jgi:hypothetical protein
MERKPALPVAEQLKEISKSPVRASVTHEGDEQIANITLPFGCSVEGRLSENAEGEKAMTVSSFLRVPENLRGNAIGERLIRGLTVVAKEQDATTLTSNISSPYALAIRRRVFGDEALDFVDAQGNTYDVTVDEVMDALKEMYAGEPDPEMPIEGIDVEVDLSKVDISSWETPLR